MAENSCGFPREKVLAFRVPLRAQWRGMAAKDIKRMGDNTVPLTTDDRQWLLGLARGVLSQLPPSGNHMPDDEEVLASEVPPATAVPRGAFVTLHKMTLLRGCIGYVLPVTPLYRAVIENTMNAARSDPRFPPVDRDEVPGLHIEISAMRCPRVIQTIDEIRVGRHGLMIRKGSARGLLLPQVATERGWDRDTFLDHACQKAGLAPDAWRNGGVEIQVFSAEVFSESPPESS
jgi:AmmeMemoRadiSam system protein A